MSLKFYEQEFDHPRLSICTLGVCIPSNTTLPRSIIPKKFESLTTDATDLTV